MPRIIDTRVDRLQPGDVVTGTIASGDFEEGPRIVEDRIKADREHSVRMTAWTITWAAGGHNVYYGDALVTAVQAVELQGALNLAAAGQLDMVDAVDIVASATAQFGQSRAQGDAR